MSRHRLYVTWLKIFAIYSISFQTLNFWHWFNVSRLKTFGKFPNSKCFGNVSRLKIFGLDSMFLLKILAMYSISFQTQNYRHGFNVSRLKILAMYSIIFQTQNYRHGFNVSRLKILAMYSISFQTQNFSHVFNKFTDSKF